jgi:hypothetical protein
MNANIGTNLETGKTFTVDIESLLKSRLLIQASSGGGKSYAIRKLIEETNGHVQQIILDIEDDFSTLREKYDFILVGRGGDVAADIRTAELLAQRVLELRADVIINLYELKHHERIIFVKRFLDAMVNAPKELWHACLIILDEAHQFAPEKTKSESLSAVIDMESRGRKRGFCLIPATQRPAKLHKDVAAECQNKLIGLANMDIDRKRAAEELGFTAKQSILSLRDLSAGEFFAVGPAFGRGVLKVKIGEVKTDHHQAGKIATKSIKPIATSKVKQILSRLEDLPKEVEQEAKDKLSLQNRIRELERELKVAKSQTKIETKVEKIVDPQAIKSAMSEFKNKIAKDLKSDLAEFHKNVIKKFNEETPQGPFEIMSGNPNNFVNKTISIPKNILTTTINSSGILPQGEKAILVACAQYPNGATREQLTVLTGYKRSSRDAYLQRLGNKNYIRIQNGQIFATEDGISALGSDFEPLPEGLELQNYWLNKLPIGESSILRILIEANGRPIDRDILTESTGYQRSSRDAYIQRLCAKQLVINEGRGCVKASPNLF